MMVYFRHYVSSRPGGFHLVSFQETKRNEKKKKKRQNIMKKIIHENEQNEK